MQTSILACPRGYRQRTEKTPERIRSLAVLTRLRPLDAIVAWVVNFTFGELLLVFSFVAGVAAATAVGWALTSVMRLAAVSVVIVWLRIVRRVGLEDLKGLFPAPRLSIIIGAGVGLAFFTIEYLLVVVYQHIDRSPNLVDGTWNPWVATRSLADASLAFVLAFGVVGPVVEEFIHRGVAYSGLRSRLSLPVAAAVSSLVFGLGHLGTVLDVISAFLFGLVAIWLVERFRSLSPAISAHVALNLTVVALGWSLYNLFGIPGSAV